RGRDGGSVEAGLALLRGGNGLLEGPSVRKGTDGDALASAFPLEHLAGTVEAEVIRNDEAGDHGLTKAPARLDQTLVGARDRVLGEHDPGAGAAPHPLDPPL